jgi:hypothetical protein
MQASLQSTSSRTASVESLMHALLGIGRLMRQRGPGETLDASTVSRHVAQLHSAGLIERTPDPADGRAQRVKLSDAGTTRIKAALRSRRDLLEKCLESWEPRDLEELDRLLTRFAADVEAVNQTMEKA